MIVTDGAGRPFPKPEKPAPGATANEVVAYLRAWHAYRDGIANSANKAFAEAFAKAL